MKNIKEDLNKWREDLFKDGRTQNCQSDILPKLMCKLNAIPVCVLAGSAWHVTVLSKTHMESAKSNIWKKKDVGLVDRSLASSFTEEADGKWCQSNLHNESFFMLRTSNFSLPWVHLVRGVILLLSLMLQPTNLFLLYWLL